MRIINWLVKRTTIYKSLKAENLQLKKSLQAAQKNDGRNPKTGRYTGRKK